MSDGGSDALERLQGALSAAGLARWVLEPGTGRLLWAEEGFEGSGWRPSEVFPSLAAWLNRVHPEDRPRAAETLETARLKGTPWRHVHRIPLPDGRIVRCRLAAQMQLGEDGVLAGMTGILQEITVDAAAAGTGDTALRSRSTTEDRNRILLEELRHRVRNSMATVRSIARNSVTAGRSVEEYVEYLDGRIAAYARVQSAAIQDPLAGLDLELLLRDSLAVLAIPDRHVRIGGPQVSLRPRVAEQLAIAFHELATNALVHGALRDETGKVDLSWHWREPARAGAEDLLLSWTETTAAPLEPEGPSGFGTEFLTRALAYTLRAVATRTCDPSGMKWEIVLPDPRQREEAASL